MYLAIWNQSSILIPSSQRLNAQTAIAFLQKHYNKVSLMSGLYGEEGTPALSLKPVFHLICLGDIEPSGAQSSQAALDEL